MPKKGSALMKFPGLVSSKANSTQFLHMLLILMKL